MTDYHFQNVFVQVKCEKVDFITLNQLTQLQRSTQSFPMFQVVVQNWCFVVCRDVASVLTPWSRGRLKVQYCLSSVSSRLKFQTPRSRLGLKTERLGLGLILDTEGLGLSLGLGLSSKCLDLVGKHFSATYVKLCLNMPLRFNLSSRVSLLLFGTTSVHGMIWMWYSIWPRS